MKAETVGAETGKREWEALLAVAPELANFFASRQAGVAVRSSGQWAAAEMIKAVVAAGTENSAELALQVEPASSAGSRRVHERVDDAERVRLPSASQETLFAAPVRGRHSIADEAVRMQAA